VFNGWCHGLFAGQQFMHVLNLGCGHDDDHQGYKYSGYFDAVKVTRVDINTHTEYAEYERCMYGDIKFMNPEHLHGNAEQSLFSGETFDMVFANWMIYQIDYKKVLSEIQHVLTPKGKILVTWMDETFYGQIYREVHKYFEVLSYCVLQMDKRLDGRDWFAEGVWGVKK
jgi:ubiquinone/menaquinone biosynthesis C-methylase UbiE